MRKLNWALAGFVLMFFYSNAEAVTTSTFLLTNMAKVSAYNAPIPVTSKTNVTTGTMFGGVAYLGTAPLESVANYGAYTWTVTISNVGNAYAGFVIRLDRSNSWVGGGTWARHFGNNSFKTNFGLAAGSLLTVPFVISNSFPASNYAYSSFQIVFSNTNAQTTAKRYLGADNATWYGGYIGTNTNYITHPTAVMPARSPRVFFLQFPAGLTGLTNQSGFVTARISGPVLLIHKTISYGESTHPSGLNFSTQPIFEPGAMIVYKIVFSNVGSAYATNVSIRDGFDNTVLSNLNNYNGSTNMAFANSPWAGLLVFTNDTFNAGNPRKLMPGQGGILRIRVTVR